MCVLVSGSYDKYAAVAWSMANPDLEFRLGGYAAARLAAATLPHSTTLNLNAQFGDPSSRGESIHLRMRVVTFVLQHAFG